MTAKQAKKGKPSEDEKNVANKNEQTTHKQEQKEETKAKANSKANDQADEIDEVDESEELNELLDMFEDEELSDIDPEEATSIIEEWHDILNHSGDANLKEIAKGLTKLKKAVSASKPKPEAIAEALTQIGEQINEYADNAERGYKTKLHKLGKSLSKAGKSLEKQEEE